MIRLTIEMVIPGLDDVLALQGLLDELHTMACTMSATEASGPVMLRVPTPNGGPWVRREVGTWRFTTEEEAAP